MYIEETEELYVIAKCRFGYVCSDASHLIVRPTLVSRKRKARGSVHARGAEVDLNWNYERSGLAIGNIGSKMSMRARSCLVSSADILFLRNRVRSSLNLDSMNNRGKSGQTPTL